MQHKHQSKMLQIVKFFVFFMLSRTWLAIGSVDRRLREFENVGKYEVINVAFDSQSQFLSFDGYGHKYQLPLQRKDNFVFNNMKHTINGKPFTDAKNGYISGLKESCHYTVLTSPDNSLIQGGAISICNKRGVRGHIVISKSFLNSASPKINNVKSNSNQLDNDHDIDILIIRPAKYYLDLEYGSSEDKFHDISDKHLIYLMSDFNSTDILFPKVEVSHKNKKKRSRQPNPPSNYQKTATKRGHRRLAAYDDENEVEMMIVADPYEYEDYLSRYGNNWYDEMSADIADYLNSASDVYESTNWGWIGSIYITFSHLEVIQYFNSNSNNANLEPSWYSSTQIDSNSYLSKFSTWVWNTGYRWDYDAYQIFSAKNMDAGGRAYLGTMCMGSDATGVTSTWSTAFWFVTHIVGHELGHTFGAIHDFQSPATCANDQGNMGYTDQGCDTSKYSSCSIGFLQDFFSDEDTSCLRDNTGGGGDGGGSGDDDDSSCDYSYDCVSLSDLESVNGNDPNAVWYYEGCHNGYAYYKATADWTNLYLYYSTQWNNWHINLNSVDDSAASWYCGNDGDVLNCDGSSDYWFYWSNGWVKDSNAQAVNSCDGNGDNNNGNTFDCDYYNCVGITNLDSNFNGNWEPVECYGDKAYYTRSNNDNYYLYYSTTYSNWHIYTSLNDASASAYCGDNDILDCGSNSWYTWSGGWISAASAYTYQCNSFSRSGGSNINEEIEDISTLNDDEEPTYVSYSDSLTDDCIFVLNGEQIDTSDSQWINSVCIYNSGSLWDGGIGTFIFDGCINDVAFFYYGYTKESQNITKETSGTYILHYDNDSTTWFISENTFDDHTGVAKCEEIDLADCTYNEWSVVSVSSDMDIWSIDESMGYDSECDGVIETQTEVMKCDIDDILCAIWMIDIEINSESTETTLCDDSYVQCISMAMINDWSHVSSNIKCESESNANIHLNVSFTSVLGSDVYVKYKSNLTNLVHSCGNDLGVDKEELNVYMIFSKLKVCDDCGNFIVADAQSKSLKHNTDNANYIVMLVLACLVQMLDF